MYKHSERGKQMDNVTTTVVESAQEYSNDIEYYVDLIRTYGASTVIVAVFIVVLLAILSYILRNNQKTNNQIIKQQQELVDLLLSTKKEDKEENSSKQQPNIVKEPDIVQVFLTINSSIKEILKDISDEIDSSRTAVYVFHNGSSSIHDLPFFKFSCIAEFIARGSGSTSKMKAHNSIPIDLLNQIIDTLIRDGNFVHFKVNKNNNLSMDETLFLNKLLLQGTEKTCILYSIYDMENRCMGFIFAEFGEDSFTKEELKEKKVHLKYLAEKLSPILEFSNYYKKKTGKLDIAQ